MVGGKVHKVCLRNCNQPRSVELLREEKICQVLGMISHEYNCPLGMSFLHGDDFIQQKNTLDICKKSLSYFCKSTSWWLRVLTHTIPESSHYQCLGASQWCFGFLKRAMNTSTLSPHLKHSPWTFQVSFCWGSITHSPLAALQTQGSSFERQFHQ